MQKERNIYMVEQAMDKNLFIPGPNFFHPGYRVQKIPGSWIRIKELMYFNPKNCLKLSEIWSVMFIPKSGSWFLPIPDRGVKKRHRNPDPQHCWIRWSWYGTVPDAAAVAERRSSGVGSSSMACSSLTASTRASSAASLPAHTNTTYRTENYGVGDTGPVDPGIFLSDPG